MLQCKAIRCGKKCEKRKRKRKKSRNRRSIWICATLHVYITLRQRTEKNSTNIINEIWLHENKSKTRKPNKTHRHRENKKSKTYQNKFNKDASASNAFFLCKNRKRDEETRGFIFYDFDVVNDNDDTCALLCSARLWSGVCKHLLPLAIVPSLSLSFQLSRVLVTFMLCMFHTIFSLRTQTKWNEMK